MKVRLTEEYDKEGNMIRIIAESAETGEHVIDAIWDPHDEQTIEKRAAFRAWVTTMLTRMGHDSIN